MISTPENTFQVTIIGDHGLWHIGRPIDSESRSQWFESHYFLECSFQTFSQQKTVDFSGIRSRKTTWRVNPYLETIPRSLCNCLTHGIWTEELFLRQRGSNTSYIWSHVWLDLTKYVIIFCSKATTESLQVKLYTSCTVILPPTTGVLYNNPSPQTNVILCTCFGDHLTAWQNG